jgi:L-lactate dehydrogenase complex protein LldE
MNVGLFIPCFIDQFFPQVALATVRVLRRYGVEVSYPMSQTCCGQPMGNAGCAAQARGLAKDFAANFGPYQYVVSPSGSCVAMVRNHYDDLLDDPQLVSALREKTFELCEFLSKVVQAQTTGRFPHRVGLHHGCHALRELRVAGSTEVPIGRKDLVRELLEPLRGIHLLSAQRIDQCCGFGGMFAHQEAEISAAMGTDRVDDFESVGAEVIASADMSCLMHLDGIIRRQKKTVRVMHVAEILDEAHQQ